MSLCKSNQQKVFIFLGSPGDSGRKSGEHGEQPVDFGWTPRAKLLKSLCHPLRIFFRLGLQLVASFDGLGQRGVQRWVDLGMSPNPRTNQTSRIHRLTSWVNQKHFKSPKTHHVSPEDLQTHSNKFEKIIINSRMFARFVTPSSSQNQPYSTCFPCEAPKSHWFASPANRANFPDWVQQVTHKSWRTVGTY